jgi:hypothetical protein
MDLGLPFLGIWMIRWIIQVCLPWRAVLAKSVRSNPLLDCGVGVLELIVRSEMNRRRSRPGRQRFGQNLALAVGYVQSPLCAVTRIPVSSVINPTLVSRYRVIGYPAMARPRCCA